jgi:RLL motif-containing protein 1
MLYNSNGDVAVESADFKKGVNTLAQLLRITSHPDHLVTLKAVSQVVCQRLSAEALENPGTMVVKVCAV